MGGELLLDVVEETPFVKGGRLVERVERLAGEFVVLQEEFFESASDVIRGKISDGQNDDRRPGTFLLAQPWWATRPGCCGRYATVETTASLRTRGWVLRRVR